MRVSWMDRKTMYGKHQAAVDTGSEVGASCSDFGHVVRLERDMENDVMLGELSRKRRRGRPITRWLDSVNTIKGHSINSIIWDTRDRDRWKSANGVVARGRTRLDGTR